MYEIKVTPISELANYNKEEFNLANLPLKLISIYRLCPQFQNKIVEEAKKINDICFATIETDEGKRVVTQILDKGMNSGFVMYNAREVKSKTDDSVHAITFNSGRGALTHYWTDVYLVYENGKVWK